MKLSDHFQPATLSPFVSEFVIPPFGFEGEEGEGGNGGEGQSNQGDQGNQGQQGGNQGGNAGQQGNQSDDDDSDDEDDDFKGLSAAELKRRLKDEAKARKAVEKDKGTLEAEKAQRDRAKNDETTNLKNDLTKEQDLTATLKATNSHLALVNSILNTTEYQWHNAEIVAQQVLSVGGVEIDPETGKVEGLKKALKKVSEDHAYLLKPQGNQGGQGNNGQGPQGRPTGIQPGQGGANNGGQQQTANRDELAKSYPALIGRG